MNQEQEEAGHWFDALAGIEPAGDAMDERMLVAVRRSAGLIDRSPPDELGLMRLLVRLEKEGLLRRRRGAWQQWMSQLATAAVIVLAIGIMLEWSVLQPYPEEAIVQPAATGQEAPPSSHSPRADSAGEALQHRKVPAAAVNEPAPEKEFRLQAAPGAKSLLEGAPTHKAETQVDDPGQDREELPGRELRSESPPEIRLYVDDPAEAYRELEALADEQAGMTVQGHAEAGRLVTCASADSCLLFNEWLRQIDPDQEFQAPGQIRVLLLPDQAR